MRFLQRHRQEHRPIDLNVIPLIDVVFFLLIFYVISTTFIQESAVELQRPASARATAVAGSYLPVAVTRAGTVHIGSESVGVTGAAPAVRAALAAHGTTRVVVVPDRQVPAGVLLEVMDACTAAGASSVSVAATRSGN